MVKQKSKRKDILSTFQKLTRKIIVSSMDKENFNHVSGNGLFGSKRKISGFNARS
ncbi:MAG TPA: hypothetical protein VEC93_17720 [Anaerolineae bacterium]|nr:hypothetical protein [Anaerolineae bacterium]